jgi:hypothetical protein
MRHNFKHILLAAGALALAGCSFLEEKSWDEVIPKSAEDFAELLVGTAYPIAGDANDVAGFSMLFDDDVTLLLPDGYNDNDLNKISEQGAIYTWQPTVGANTDAFSTIYYSYYTKIMGCNAVLDLIDDAVGLPAERDRVKAEALALRAYYYFMLVNFYGEPYNYDGAGHGKESLGVPLKLNSVIDEQYPARNTVGEVYTQIVADMTEALRLMGPLPVIRGDFRFNRPAMHILLSRIYLHMNEWEKCVEQVDAVSELGGVVFDMPGSLGATQTVNTSYYLYYGWNPELEWAFGSVPCIDTGRPAEGRLTWDAAKLDEVFGATEKLRDTRFIHGFTGQNNMNIMTERHFLSKFANAVTDNKHPMQSLRTAEAVLNMAEALAELDDLGGALSAYNLLRRNRILNYVDESITVKDELIGAIRAERRREFFYEGFRWFDLRRYGMPRIVHPFAEQVGQTVYYVREERDPMYTLPLENSLLLKNANLVQNPSASAPQRTPTLNP